MGAQLLAYPVLDFGTFATESYAKWGAGFGLDRDTMQWFWNLYLSSPNDGLSCYAAPMKAVDLSGLPATYILSAKHDVLCDEGALYASRLRAAGVPVTFQESDDMNHGFLYWVGALDRATQALEVASTWLKANLQSTSPG